MKNQFDTLLENDNLSKEAKKALTEAWNNKLTEVEMNMRKEYSEKYNADKKDIVEGMDMLVRENLKETISKFNEFTLKVLAEEVKELAKDRKEHKGKFNKFCKMTEDKMAEEMLELKNDVKAVKGNRSKALKKAQENSQTLEESLEMFQHFIKDALVEEARKMKKDRDALRNAKETLLKEGREKFNQARKNFIDRAATQAAKVLDETLQKELGELKHDLMESKKNMFGRKLFEAYEQEFKTSLYENNKEIKNLAKKLENTEKENKHLLESIAIKEEQLNEAVKKAYLVENDSRRKAVLGELVAPLSKTQKIMMEKFLKDTPTKNLREDFSKYLKTVLNEDSDAFVRNSNKILTEVTGNRTNSLNESVEEDEELSAILKLANYSSKGDK